MKVPKGTHKIENINYREDWLLCVCGWRGKALDEADFRLHRKTAPPTDKVVEPIIPKAVYNTRILQLEG